jgi:hypothetical protein
MASIDSLASRIDAEFSAVEKKAQKQQAAQLEEQKQRQKRLEHLGKVFDELQDALRPRLELLVKKFGDRVQATPRIVPSTREVSFQFKSHRAQVRLKFSACTDQDIQKVILGYDLEIVPILMRFKAHDEMEFPLNAIDKEAAINWMDDRIVEFIQTYFAMGESEIYLKD